MKPFSEACERNRQPILTELLRLFSGIQRENNTDIRVLEIGSGTGQHAVFFARTLCERGYPVSWQPTERAEQLEGIHQWRAAERAPRCLVPKALDLEDPPQIAQNYDCVFTANTFHIVRWELVKVALQLAANALGAGGLFIVYGPFNYAGEYTSDSNAQFDRWLKARDPHSGIRDIEALTEFAASLPLPLALLEDNAMPANNRLLVFEKR